MLVVSANKSSETLYLSAQTFKQMAHSSGNARSTRKRAFLYSDDLLEDSSHEHEGRDVNSHGGDNGYSMSGGASDVGAGSAGVNTADIDRMKKKIRADLCQFLLSCDRQPETHHLHEHLLERYDEETASLIYDEYYLWGHSEAG